MDPIPDSAPRLAVTVEQCWHRVPGGTATAVLAALDAMLRRPAPTRLRMVGVAASHRRPPPAPLRPPIPVRSLPLPRPLLYEAWHRLRWPPVERAVGTVDAIWASGVAVPPATAPLVVTVHDLAFRHEPAHTTSRGLRVFTRAVDLARRHASVVVCPSEATAQDVVAAGFDAGRVRVVPWSTTVVPPGEDDVARVRTRYRLPERFVLWVGTIEPRKNLPVLLEAWGRLRRDGGASTPPLVLVGPAGWGTHIDRLLSESLDTAARDGVQVPGYVPAGDLAALYGAASVLCYPSVREGFGMPVLEALACGTPVVTSRGTATEEVLGPSGPAGTLVDPADPAELCEALRGWLWDPDARDAARGPALARARTFSPGRTAAGMEGAVRDALRGGR